MNSKYGKMGALIIIALISMSLCTNSCTQNKLPVKEILTSEELRQDFSALREILEETHPGLYTYKSKSTIDSIFDSNYLTLNKTMTRKEFMLLTCKVVSQIGDGHLKIVPPKTQLDSLDLGRTAIPFNVYLDNDKLYVRKNYSPLEDREFRGAQIVSINDHLIEDFIREYLQIYPSDGNNVTRKYRILSSSRYFTRYFSMLYGYSEQYNIEYIPLNEKTIKTATLQGLDFDELLEISNKRYPKKIEVQKPAYFKVSEDKKYAYLKVYSFSKSNYKRSKMSFEKFLKASFEKMRSDNVPNLILDLLDNGGGTDEYGKILFSYFVNQPFNYYKSLRMNKESFESFKYTSRPNAKTPKGMLKPNEEGTFDNIQHPNVGRQNPLSPVFSGNIYVLINGRCFSTTSEFLSQLHFNTDAVFIGEESGGGYYGNFSGLTPDFTLPNTKVRIEIPLMNYRMAVENYQYTDRGLIPNFIVKRTIIDEINNTNPELNFAKKLIEGK